MMKELLETLVQGYPFGPLKFAELLDDNEPTLIVFLRHFG